MFQWQPVSVAKLQPIKLGWCIASLFSYRQCEQVVSSDRKWWLYRILCTGLHDMMFNHMSCLVASPLKISSPSWTVIHPQIKQVFHKNFPILFICPVATVTTLNKTCNPTPSVKRRFKLLPHTGCHTGNRTRFKLLQMVFVDVVTYFDSDKQLWMSRVVAWWTLLPSWHTWLYDTLAACNTRGNCAHREIVIKHLQYLVSFSIR